MTWPSASENDTSVLSTWYTGGGPFSSAGAAHEISIAVVFKGFSLGAFNPAGAGRGKFYAQIFQHNLNKEAINNKTEKFKMGPKHSLNGG